MFQLLFDLLSGGIARDARNGAIDDGFFAWAFKRLALLALAVIVIGIFVVLSIPR